MAAPYNIVQTAFLISMTANGASDIAATQTQLQTYLTTALNGGTDPIGTQFVGFFPAMNPQLAGGDWSVVWGPCVYSSTPDQAAYAANAMYVAYSASQSTYIVAIAATNPDSLYDWIAEDGDVSPVYMAQWPFPVPFVRTDHWPWVFDPPPAVSAATARGVSNLLTQMTDPVRGTLQSFLTHAANANSTLIFGGHSLAGALAPTLAMYLYPQPASTGWKQVLTLPTAGASPGNTKFAALFATAYPPVSSGVGGAYDEWNTDYANANDVVPHAWNQLSEVISEPDPEGNYPSIYGVMNPTIGKGVTDAIEAAEALAFGGYYLNLTQTKFQPIWGTWTWVQNQDGSWQYPPTWTPLTTYTDADPISTVEVFGALVLAAHVNQYDPFFEVTPGPRMPTNTPAQEAAAKLQTALLAASKVST
jgi:hypothetical protein